ncbi:ATP-dependent DNA helicase RecG [Geobacter argillaceus]|uniref:ATP-dependent DNA helicase RecG n=1 Tax=Geobacter argillaceus TaxID=345631 RepID=A0A562V6W3_9BACT|nr:ATP-dependent DNA helicase RecG [Geobacter argillaceus]TWJ13655.1 ATP-dependent DNA helicase RecG [Geobacter argillaceus]
MPIITLSDKNSVTLTDELIATLGLSPGDRLSVEPDGEGRLLLTRAPAPATVPTLQESINRRNLATSIQFIKGVGPKLFEALVRKGITTVEDALYLLPNRYEDRRELRPVAKLRPGCTELFTGTIVSAEALTTRGGRKYFEVIVRDESGSVSLKWFNFVAVWMKRTWKQGRRAIFTGEVAQFGFQKEVHHPEVEWLAEGEEVAAVMAREPASFGRIVPVYPLTEGVQQRTMRKIMQGVAGQFAANVVTVLDRELIARQRLLPLARALQEVHLPSSEADPERLNCGATPAHRSLVFDEFFFLELGLALKRRGFTLEAGIPFQVTHRYTKPLLKMLPFSLTNAQRRVLSEIKEEMMTPHPMHRLVQGDVGSGKTLVALMAALVAVENGYQVAIMAPTEILAEQHYLNIHGWCDALGIRTVLLTAGLKGKARAAVLAQVEDGSASIVIGTHAVIQEKVAFQRLGLGIIDEQHRFGVVQRGVLRKKGVNPDILVMTATPIPRTLAMTVFGDLSLSVIDELPPGRTPVETRIVTESRRHQVYGIIREEVRAGRQAYLICPLVEETETSELKAATQMAEHLQSEIFPELRVGLLHGRMRPEEKEAVMRSFKTGELQLLVATTVIEVGIDVPNATVIVIEHAERFGLSQLHQLRGRVGRGSHRSRCLLLASDRLSEDGVRRLRVMEETTDGFRIAEADLEIRGPGDFLGTRQAGLPDFRIANILRDGRILEEARKEAFSLVEQDPELSLPEHGRLREELVRRWGGRLELAGIA